MFRTFIIRAGQGLFAATLFLSIPAVGYGATYYVEKTGSDANTCTAAKLQSTAKQTITAGIACLVGSDTLIIGNGVYNEAINDNIPSGTTGAPTVIRAATRNGVILRPVSAAFAVSIGTQNYITLDGIDADVVNYSDSEPYYIWGTANHIVIQNGTARNGSGVYGQGIELKGTNDNLVLNMDVFDNGWTFHAVGTPVSTPAGHGIYVSGMRNIVDGNRFKNNGVYGIQVYNGSGTIRTDANIVRNNIVYSNPKGMVIASGNNIEAYNNIIYSNGGGINVSYGATNARIYNNTVYSNSNTYCVLTMADTRGTDIRNNICYANTWNTVQVLGTVTANSNNLFNNPSFVDAARGNFRLSSNSMARGAGVAVGQVTADFAGVTRPNPPAIGAFEYVGTTETQTEKPKAPTNLRIVAQ